MAESEKGVSPEEIAWIDEVLRFKVSERIDGVSEAGKAADLLSKALGGSAPKENIEGWLQSVPEVVDKASVIAVEESEKVVSEQSGDSGLKAEVGDEDEVSSEDEVDSDDIPDEVYAELGAALAEDLIDAIAGAEKNLFEFLATDEEGLCAGVRDQLLASLREQKLLGDDPSAIAEAMRDIAWNAVTEAFSGLYEELEAAGGYEWLLTTSEEA